MTAKLDKLATLQPLKIAILFLRIAYTTGLGLSQWPIRSLFWKYKVIFENIYIEIDKAILENIDIDKDDIENINIDGQHTSYLSIC